LQLGFLKMLRGTGVRLRAAEHQYVYMDHSPYEILGNNVLPFDDIVKIKQVEDVLEKYWNDHRMDFTIEYLVTKVFPSPFDFFQQFGSFWNEQGWSRIGHQLEDLFRRLFSFLEYSETANKEIIIGLMKYDYLRNHKYKPRKPWWESSFNKEKRTKIYKQIIESPALLGSAFLELGLDEKELFKHTMLEELCFDLTEYLSTGQLKIQATCLLAYFDPTKEQTLIFSIKE
jgi:anaerobic magnesium-protoporphyrin IX monomethyl ester cyclase